MPFAIALMLSAMVHAAAIVMPGWSLPGDADPEPQMLEARLAPPPAPVVPKAKARAHPVHPSAKVETPHQPAAGATPSEPAEPAAPPQSAEPAPPPVPAAAPAPPWPSHGRLRYVVRYGNGGFILGETIQEWRIEDGHYSIRSVAEPKGLAALRGSTRTQVSEGEVSAAGFRPQEFRDQREGREVEVATFDWPAGEVNFSGGRAASRVADGMQDMTSVFYQLAWLAPRQDVEVSVATGSRVGRWKFEWVGEETLELVSGSQPTLHLRTRSDGDVTEVWLAPAYGGLPVKIRHVDRKGDAFEQTADSPETN